MMVARRVRRPHSQQVDEQEELFGWKPKHDVGRKPRLTKFSRLELVPFSKTEKEGGQLLLRWDFGLEQARWLWLYQEEVIPPEWQAFVLVFPGKVWIRPDGSTAVAYLIYWEEYQRWVLSYDELSRLIRGKKSRIVRLA